MAIIDINTTVESKALNHSIVPVSDGRFLIVTDTKKLMYDYGTERIVLGDIIELDTEAQRIALITPLNKFYFVKETGVLWRYNSNAWICWDNANTINAHINHLVSSDSGVHGIRYNTASQIMEIYDAETESWIPMSNGGNSTSIEGTLFANGWTNGEQTITVSGLLASQNGIIGLTQNISSVQIEAVRLAELYIVGQADGTVTIAADGEIPTCDIPVVVILLA